MIETITLFVKDYFNEFLYTTLSFVVLTVIYGIAFIAIEKNKNWSVSKKHRMSISIRNVLIIIFLFTFLFIWSGELKTFLLSATALVGALFIVFKEVLLSISGGILMGNNFDVGERVEYDGVEGIIVDKTILYTKIGVSGPYNNKELIIPNIFFLTNKMTNSSNYGKFAVFKIEMGAKDAAEAFENGKVLLQVSKKIMADYKSKYYDYFKELKDKQKNQFLFEIPELEPKITYHLGDTKKIYCSIHYVAHPNEQETIEQDILNEFFKVKKPI